MTTIPKAQIALVADDAMSSTQQKNVKIVLNYNTNRT